MEVRPDLEILIVGGGFSGVALGTNLVAKKAGLKIAVARDPKQPRFGMAYETDCPLHLLNVPAKGMSALADQPNDFIDWAASQGITLAPNDFAPRMTYRAYLEHLWSAQLLTGQVAEVADEITSLKPEGDQWVATTSEGLQLTAQTVVLAFGVFPPDPFLAASQVQNDPRYHPDPWHKGNSSEWGAEKRVAIIGTGLTAVDVVLTGESAGWKGHYTMISRSGRLSQIHDLSTPALPPDTIPPPVDSARALLKALREAAKNADIHGSNWRAVVDGMRPKIPIYWQTLSEQEKRRFLSHLRPFWEIHRHRMAPEIAARLESLKNEGRLSIIKGGVRQISADSEGLVLTGPEASYRFDRIYNCTGPTGKLTMWPSPLIRQLIQDGQVALDSGQRGINFEGNGRVCGSAKGLYVLGHPRKGIQWESTAVPELRVQAANLATELAQAV